MIRLVNFLLLVKNLTNYNKKDIDVGKTPLEIYKICSCLRETFCLSYAIRKENNLFLYFQNEGVLIKFKGNRLKYLGPDERSQALLLRKALDKINLVNSSDIEDWRKSTPGIHIRKFSNNESFIKYFKSFPSFKPIFLIHDDFVGEVNSCLTVNEFEKLNTISEFFYIIPAYNIITEDSNFFQLFKDLKDIKFLTLSKINRIEDKFLYVNFRLDLLRKQN